MRADGSNGVCSPVQSCSMCFKDFASLKFSNEWRKPVLNCWIWAVSWYITIKRARLFIYYCFNLEMNVSFLFLGRLLISGWCISLVSLALVLLLMREAPFYSTLRPPSLTKQTQISLHLSAAALLWKLMNCRDRLILFALLETSVLKARTLEPPEIKS